MSNNLLDEYEKLRKKLLKKQNISTGKTKLDSFEDELKISKKQIKEIFKKHNFKGQKNVLEVGSGTGHKTIAISEFVQRAYGIEPIKEEYLMSNIKKKYLKNKNSTFYNCGNEKMPFKNNFFDTIISITVLEHVNSVDNSLKEIHRTLKKNGKFYLECPNYNWIHEPHYHYFMFPQMPKIIFKIIAKIKGDDSHFINHINYITPNKLKKKLNKFNLKIEIDYSLEVLESILIKKNWKNIPTHYSNYKKILKFMYRLKLNKILYITMKKLGFYPVINMLIVKND